MKRSIIIIITLTGILAICNACAGSAGNTNTAASNAVAVNIAPASSASPLANTSANTEPIDEGLVEVDPAEAEDAGDEGWKEAKKFWSRYAPTCDGVTYMKSGRNGFMEMEGFEIKMEYAPLTRADELNGLESRGMTRLVMTMHRLFYDSKWHDWQDGMPSNNIGRVADFQKYKGQWKFEGGGYFKDFAQPMTCAEIPSSTNADNPLLRFDGVYRAYGEDAEPKDDTTYWLKFYQDGTAASVANQNASYKNSGSWWTVKKVWECLASRNQGEPCRPEVAQGTYSVNGSNLIYQQAQKGATTERKGSVGENSLKMVIGKNPDGSPVRAVFKFVEINPN